MSWWIYIVNDFVKLIKQLYKELHYKIPKTNYYQ